MVECEPHLRVVLANSISQANAEVLKQRLCPNFSNFEVHDARVPCWPSWSDLGFFEKGKDGRNMHCNAC